jgi:soluble lytic murein transglycosylase-like protein
MDRVRRFVSSNGRPPARGGSLGSIGAVLAVCAAAVISLMPACGQTSDTAPAKATVAPGAGPLAAAGEPAGRAGSDPAAQGLRIAWLPEDVLRYKPELEAAAQKHGVDAALLAIVALVESGGDPKAISSAGAVGLMQIMPKTAARIANERGIDDYSPEKLWEPAYSVDFAAWLLSRHIDEFGGGAAGREDGIALVAAAYNAGARRVRAYLDAGEPLPEESAHYKDLVAAMWKERGAPGSATYDALRRRMSERMKDKAQ